MKMDRDAFLIMMTLAPIIGGLYIYFNWQTTGSLPFGIPTFPIPSIPTITPPSFIPTRYDVPPGVIAAAHRASRNIWLIVLGLVGGAVLGIGVIGTVADIARGSVSGMSRRLKSRHGAIELDAESSSDSTRPV